MESFLNKVEREANEEVKRIHREAQQIVDILKALNLEIPKELQHLVAPISAKEAVTTLENVTEALEPKKPRKVGDHTKRIAKLKAKAEADYQETRTAIREFLGKGPRLRAEVFQLVNQNKYRIQTTASRMKKEGELDYRVKGYQGSTEWFLVERPVTLEQLRDEVVDRKGGDIPLQGTQSNLGFQREEHLIKMLDELVAQGIIWRTDHETYANFEWNVMSDTRTLHEKKKYSGGNAVAGTGRFNPTSNHDVGSYLDKVRAQGASVKLTNGGHIQIEHNGKTVTVGKSPSRSGILQDKSRVKQVLGLNV